MDPKNQLVIKKISVQEVITKSNLPAADYCVNPYVGCTHGCKYCYASFMKRFTNHPEPWGTFLDVKFWPEIKNAQKYAGAELFFGSVTDPYNPQEEVYRRTRALLEQLKGADIKLSIQTKSDLVLRDLDLIHSFPKARVGFSINTLDEVFRSEMDHAVSIERRLAAMKKVHDSGVYTACFISPIFPGITDVKAIIERVKNDCNFIWLENLNLRGAYKAVIWDYIAKKYADLLPLYDEIYNKKENSYWEKLDKEIGQYALANHLEYVYNQDDMNRPFSALPVIVNFFYHEKIRKNSTL